MMKNPNQIFTFQKYLIKSFNSEEHIDQTLYNENFMQKFRSVRYFSSYTYLLSVNHFI